MPVQHLGQDHPSSFLSSRWEESQPWTCTIIRLQLIQENAERLGVADKIQTKKLDASQVFEAFGADAFDKILVDAPCSGIGLIRRKPDIKYNKDNADFASLQAIQLEILDGVCQSVRKDGIIVYSTCTIIGEENFDVVDQFLKNPSKF